MNEQTIEPFYRIEIKVPPEVVDGNGHVNNVAYVQWMQDVAIGHAEVSGCTAVTRALGATWVARTHRIEYLRPAFGGDTITVTTWVCDFRKVRSLRRYKFVRAADSTILAEAETDWVFVDSRGRPASIPEEVRNKFRILSKEQEP